jgi:hypothetical protein
MAATTRKASSGKAPPPDTDTDAGTDAGTAEAETAGTGLSRAVIWTGIALGTALAVLVISDGARLRIGGMPGWLGVSVGAVIVWVLIVLAAVTLAELTRRHHKTAGKYALRQGKRGALATGRRARRHGRALITRGAAWAGPRWQGRRSAGPGSDPAAVPPGGSAPPAVTPRAASSGRWSPTRRKAPKARPTSFTGRISMTRPPATTASRTTPPRALPRRAAQPIRHLEEP